VRNSVSASACCWTLFGWGRAQTGPLNAQRITINAMIVKTCFILEFSTVVSNDVVGKYTLDVE